MRFALVPLARVIKFLYGKQAARLERQLFDGFICGHSKPGLESSTANPGKHAPTRTIHQEIAPT
jgi:hypothetical protein